MDRTTAEDPSARPDTPPTAPEFVSWVSYLISPFRQILSSFSSSKSCSTSATSLTLPITLETLPNEILSSIVLELGSFILPPLSKRLLPFHRSQLYRKVTINFDQFESFKQAIETNAILPPLVEILALNINPSKSAQYHLWRSLLSSCPNLERVAVGTNAKNFVRNYPQVSDFEHHPQLENFTVRTAAYWKYEEEEEDLVAIISEKFHWPSQSGQGILGRIRATIDGIIELRRVPRALPGLRYLSEDPSASTLTRLLPLLKATQFSQIEVVVFADETELNNLLLSIHPSTLTHLSLYSRDFAQFYGSNIFQPNTIFSRFQHLTHLTLGGHCPLIFGNFYDSLGQLPLEYLHFGCDTSIRIQSMIDLLSDHSKPKLLSTLKRLVLDNVRAPRLTRSEEDSDNPVEAEPPKWTDECSKEKVKKLRNLAKDMGIECLGSTFKALGTN